MYAHFFIFRPSDLAIFRPGRASIPEAVRRILLFDSSAVASIPRLLRLVRFVYKSYPALLGRIFLSLESFSLPLPGYGPQNGLFVGKRLFTSVVKSRPLDTTRPIAS